MGHFAKSVTLRTSTMAGLAIALALPFTRPADPLPRAGTDTAAPGFTLSVVHQFPAALQTTPKYLALSRDGNLYGATSAVGTSNSTVFRLILRGGRAGLGFMGRGAPRPGRGGGQAHRGRWH
jgi:hypothetical protein